MWIVILVYILNDKPTDPPAFGVLGEFKNVHECVMTIAGMDIKEEDRKKLQCMELRKPVEI